MFILLLNEDIVFLQLAYTWVKDPQKGINLSKGGDNSVIGPPLIMKSDTVWMCVCIFLLLLGKKWYVEITCSCSCVQIVIFGEDNSGHR